MTLLETKGNIPRIKTLTRKNTKHSSGLRVTIDEIGRRLEVSKSTVSRALRDDPLIHPQTRARVNALAMELGYQGRARRGTRKTSRTTLLAVLMSAESLSEIEYSPTMTGYLQGLTSEAAALDVSLNLQTVPRRMRESIARSRRLPDTFPVDGCNLALLVGRHDPEEIQKLSESLPVLSFVREYPGVAHDVVCTDDARGISLMVRQAASLGHRRLAWIAGFETDASYMSRRTGGFCEGCLAAGLKIADQFFLTGETFNAQGLLDPQPILREIRSGATALICASDFVASRTASMLTTHGISVPREVSVTGFDALPQIMPGSVQLTSFNPNFVEMGRAALRLARWRLDQLSAVPRALIVRGEPVPGETLGPCRTGRARKTAT